MHLFSIRGRILKALVEILRLSMSKHDLKHFLEKRKFFRLTECLILSIFLKSLAQKGPAGRLSAEPYISLTNIFSFFGKYFNKKR